MAVAKPVPPAADPAGGTHNHSHGWAVFDALVLTAVIVLGLLAVEYLVQGYRVRRDAAQLVSEAETVVRESAP